MSSLPQKLYNAKWLIFGIALILLLLWIMRPFLDVIVYAIFVYYITRPIAHWLGKRIKNKSLAVTISLLLLALPLILLIAYTLLFGLSQLIGVINDYGLTSAIPAGPLANVTATFGGLQDGTAGGFSLTNITSQGWYKQITSYSGLLPTAQAILFATGGTIADILFKLFLIFFIAFTLLNEDDRLRLWFSGAFPHLVEERSRLFVRYLKGVDEDLQKIFFSNLLSIVFFALIAVFAFILVNTFAPTPSQQIPEPVLLGILCGVCALVPLVGMWLVLGPLLVYMIAVGLATGTLLPNIVFFILAWVFIFIFVTTLPGFVVGPLIARGHVKTGLLMFAYLIGPLVFGISGIFLGVIVLVLLVNYFSIVLPEVSGELTVGEVGD